MVDVKLGRELLAEATPGEWEVRRVQDQTGEHEPSPSWGVWDEDNLAFAAWAHNNAEALLSAAERVEGTEHVPSYAEMEDDLATYQEKLRAAESDIERERGSIAHAEMRESLAVQRAEAAERRVTELEAENDDAKDNAHKYYVKARVYGAIAAKFNEVLTAIVAVGDGAGAVALARGALRWTHSDRNGVPFAAVEEVGKLLVAERAHDEAVRRAEAAEGVLRDVKQVMSDCASHAGYVVGGDKSVEGVRAKWPPCETCVSALDHFEHCKAVCERIDATLDPKGVKPSGVCPTCGGLGYAKAPNGDTGPCDCTANLDPKGVK